jgi:NTP pyrophosphatase (non-canonical NTP hydrolase)
MPNPFRSGTEIMLAITEEAGEVATEVALLERVGTKAGWEKEPSAERLAEELAHLLNLTVTLANFYQVDLEQVYEAKIGKQ